MVRNAVTSATSATSLVRPPSWVITVSVTCVPQSLSRSDTILLAVSSSSFLPNIPGLKSAVVAPFTPASTTARRSSFSFWQMTFSMRLENTNTAGAKCRAVAVSCFTCCTVWSLRVPMSLQPTVHFNALSMWYLSPVRCLATFCSLVLSLNRTSSAARSFCSFMLSIPKIPSPTGVFEAAERPANSQVLATPVHLAASDDFTNSKHVLHITSISSMSMTPVLLTDGL
mmetsp:Transcript_63725/g.170747  ORF Transcript_63725/g.170747 Transcript_63725/m.170747 type:complete len:227 (+) Transcript_63725:348-1028(+)